MSGTPHRGRVMLVWAAATAAAITLGWWCRADLAPRAGTSLLAGSDVEGALVRCCEAVLLVCVAWAWAATTAVVLPLLRGGRGGRAAAAPTRTPGVPVGWRRLVLLACGVALGAGAVPAQAASGPTYDGGRGMHHPIRASAWALDGLPLPRRPVTTTSSTAPTSRHAPPVSTSRELVVTPGNSLWSISAADLGASASPTEIATRCLQVYDANRSVIGADPDLVLPGQRLVLP